MAVRNHPFGASQGQALNSWPSRILGEVAPLVTEALADHAGIDRSHMGKLERGERNVSFLNIVRIAKAIQCKPSDLFMDADL